MASDKLPDEMAQGQSKVEPLTYEAEVHAMLCASAGNTKDLLGYFEAQAAEEKGEAKKLTEKCIQWKRDDLDRIKALIPLALERRDAVLEAYAAGQREMRASRDAEWIAALTNNGDGGTGLTDYVKGLFASLSLSPPSASAPPATGDTRSIQEVLRLHVRSSESMEGTYEPVGTKEELAYQKGITVGLKRAIEVADYRDDKASAPPVEVPGKVELLEARLAEAEGWKSMLITATNFPERAHLEADAKLASLRLALAEEREKQ